MKRLISSPALLRESGCQGDHDCSSCDNVSADKLGKPGVVAADCGNGDSCEGKGCCTKSCNSNLAPATTGSVGILVNPDISLDAVMAFQFDPLVHRMVDKYKWPEADAIAAFEDTKRFLYLCGASVDGTAFAPTETIDEVWHNFILFMEDYMKFCKDHFGRIILHCPRRRDEKPSGGKPVRHTMQMARAIFGDNLSKNWEFLRADGTPYQPESSPELAMENCKGSTNCQDKDCHDSVRDTDPISIAPGNSDTGTSMALESLNTVLGYKNPDVVARLAKEQNMSIEEAQALLDDTIRFLWLAEHVKFPICPTPRIDLGWHVFLLFTVDYREFCEKYFGKYLDHLPRRLDDKPDGGAMVRMSREYSQKVLAGELGLTLSANWVYSTLEADGKCCGNCGSGCCKR